VAGPQMPPGGAVDLKAACRCQAQFGQAGRRALPGPGGVAGTTEGPFCTEANGFRTEVGEQPQPARPSHLDQDAGPFHP